MPPSSGETTTLNWATDISQEHSLGFVNWEALAQYAINVKTQRDGNDASTTCQLSSEYNKGGLNLVRRLDFQDGTRWVARIQLHTPTLESVESLSCEVHTMALVQELSKIPVPTVYAYEANYSNAAAVPFTMMEFVPGDTAMDSFGGHAVHKGECPAHFKAKFHAAMADIQVQMSAIRFQRIGRIVKCPDGTYSVGPLPGIGGPFDSAAQFFQAWADKVKFPYRDDMIRERTPTSVVENVLGSIKDFPFRLKGLAQTTPFRGGPFPLFHTDFYSSNMIIDPQYNILSIIDWENAFVVPWEMVEFAKDLSIVPPAMDGRFYKEDEAKLQRLAERKSYVKSVREAEAARGLDNRLSATLGDSVVQHFAHAVWLYQDGRIGFYCDVLDEFIEGSSVVAT